MPYGKVVLNCAIMLFHTHTRTRTHQQVTSARLIFDYISSLCLTGVSLEWCTLSLLSSLRTLVKVIFSQLTKHSSIASEYYRSKSFREE